MYPRRRFRRMRCDTFGFRSITFEGMHQFHVLFTKGYSIIKYRTSSNLGGVIRKLLIELWPLFYLDVG